MGPGEMLGRQHSRQGQALLLPTELDLTGPPSAAHLHQGPASHPAFSFSHPHVPMSGLPGLSRSTCQPRHLPYSCSGTTPGAAGWRAPKDTKTLICDFKVPQVYPQVVRRHVGLVVAVDGDGVDVVGMSIGKHPPGGGLHHQVHGPEHRYLRDRSRASAPRDRVRPSHPTHTSTRHQGTPPGPQQAPAEHRLPALHPTHILTLSPWKPS